MDSGVIQMKITELIALLLQCSVKGQETVVIIQEGMSEQILSVRPNDVMNSIEIVISYQGQ